MLFWAHAQVSMVMQWLWRYYVGFATCDGWYQKCAIDATQHLSRERLCRMMVRVHDDLTLGVLNA